MKIKLIEFFKKCPICGTISGFYLLKDRGSEKFYCQNCGKESSLNKWKKSTSREYSKQLKDLIKLKGGII